MPEDVTDNFWKTRREELFLSQRAMAQRLGVSNTSIAAWEDGLVVPQAPIVDLAEAYAVSEDVIGDALITQRKAIEERRATAASH